MILKERLDDFLAGFDSMYRWIMGHTKEIQHLLDELEKIADAQKQSPTQIVCRRTIEYDLAVKSAISPRSLRYGIDFCCELELLSWMYTGTTESSRFRKLFIKEIEALSNLDIPRFEKKLAKIFDFNIMADRRREKLPGRVQYKLVNLSREDYVRQENVVRATFLAKEMHLRRFSNTTGECLFQDQIEFDEKKIVKTALLIGDKIWDLSTEHGAGKEHSWPVAILWEPRADKFRVGSIGLSIYDGLSGIALYFTMLAVVSQQEQYSERVELILNNLSNLLERDEFRKLMLNTMNLGIASGITSLFYSLTVISEYLSETKYLDLAEEVARLIKEEHIIKDNDYCIANGSAGFILGCLKLYNNTKNKRYIKKAETAAYHLVSSRSESRTGHKVWRVFGNHLTGASHGAAGISYALISLYAETENLDYLTIGLEAIEFENCLFDSAKKNWPDLRGGRADKQSFAWCHGAPGIGICRMGLPEIVKSARVEEDISVSIESAIEHLGKGPLSLCCGDLGRAETILIGADKRNRTQLINHITEKLLPNIYSNLPYENKNLQNSVRGKFFDIGLFQGAAGIGYLLLRVASPQRVNPILLWK